MRQKVTFRPLGCSIDCVAEACRSLGIIVFFFTVWSCLLVILLYQELTGTLSQIKRPSLGWQCSHTEQQCTVKEREADWEWTALTLFRKPLSTLAAFTDRDLGIRMGFSRITVGKKEKKDSNKEGESQRKREGMKRTIVSREEDDSRSNLPVGAHVCCVGVKGREKIQRTLFCSFTHFWWSTHNLETPTAPQCRMKENKKHSENTFFPSKPKSKDAALLHTLVLHTEVSTDPFLQSLSAHGHVTTVYFETSVVIPCQSKVSG